MFENLVLSFSTSSLDRLKRATVGELFGELRYFSAYVNSLLLDRVVILNYTCAIFHLVLVTIASDRENFVDQSADLSMIESHASRKSV